MSSPVLELLSRDERTDFNLRRWAELLDDPQLALTDWRVETDRHGQIMMSPPPAPDHGRYQSESSHLLRMLLPRGATLTECPISTADGVKAADAAWASRETMKVLGEKVCFPKAPEICVEVISPANSREQIKEKLALYFDADAREVWVCSNGAMKFYISPDDHLPNSRLCPDFSARIELWKP